MHSLISMTSKNHTISKVVAKTLVRLLLFTLLLSIYLFASKSIDLDTQIYFEHAVAMIAPLILFIVVFVLLIFTLKNKYNITELNWLFSLSSIFLIVYILMLYTRIYPLF